jgi:hypothetical protein
VCVCIYIYIYIYISHMQLYIRYGLMPYVSLALIFESTHKLLG